MKVNLEDVITVYRGRPNRCMCGCSGKYIYTNANRVIASNHRGYKVNDDDINDAIVKRIIKKFDTDMPVKDWGNGIYELIIGNTQYTLYTMIGLNLNKCLNCGTDVDITKEKKSFSSVFCCDECYNIYHERQNAEYKARVAQDIQD